MSAQPDSREKIGRWCHEQNAQRHHGHASGTGTGFSPHPGASGSRRSRAITMSISWFPHSLQTSHLCQSITVISPSQRAVRSAGSGFTWGSAVLTTHDELHLRSTGTGERERRVRVWQPKLGFPSVDASFQARESVGVGDQQRVEFGCAPIVECDEELATDAAARPPAPAPSRPRLVTLLMSNSMATVIAKESRSNSRDPRHPLARAILPSAAPRSRR